MKSTALVFVLFAYSAIAALQHDAVLPEAFIELPTAQLLPTELMSEDSLVESYAKANQTVTQLGDSNACKDLADDTEQAVQDSVKAQQVLIDAMANGTECRAAGDLAISAAKTSLDEAQTAYDNAVTAVSIAKNKTIVLGSMDWSSMEEKDCSSKFFEQGAWAEQKKVVDEATSKSTQASGALDGAKKANDSADADADDLVGECHCKVIDDYEAAIVKANADVKVANEKAWTQAAHIRCVADGTKLDECTVSDCPQVVAKALPAETQCNMLKLNDEGDVFCDKSCKKTIVELLSINTNPAGCSPSKNWDATDLTRFKKDGFEKCGSSADSSVTFHNNCNGANHALLVIAKGVTNGEYFGAFTPKYCAAMNSGYEKVPGVKLFNLDHKWLFPAKNAMGVNNALYCQNENGPTFGGGFDFLIKMGSLNKNSAFNIDVSFTKCMAVPSSKGRKKATFVSGMTYGAQKVDFFAYKSL